MRRRADGRVLRSERAATDEIARLAIAGVDDDAAPEQAEHAEMAVIAMHAGAAEFDQLATQRFVRREIEFLLAVVAEMRGGELPGLEAIGADDFAGVLLLDEQVVAVGVVGILIAPERVRGGEPFAEFEIEDFEAQPLRGEQILRRGGQAEAIGGRTAAAGAFGEWRWWSWQMGLWQHSRSADATFHAAWRGGAGERGRAAEN